jgi:hypothetical protein
VLRHVRPICSYPGRRRTSSTESARNGRADRVPECPASGADRKCRCCGLRSVEILQRSKP